jgi:hydroxymethylbilane synthase
MLVIASRGSQLALWQARWVSAQLQARGHENRIEIIKTTGDKITGVPLSKVGTKGLFTKEIEEALLDGRADLAVHSLKDLPTELPEGLVLAAVPEREDPRDAVIGKRLDDLAQGARVGTSSLRRAAQLRKLRPDLVVESVRGNLDTRLRKLDEGQYDAILLAAAGLKRLGWGDRIAEILPPERMCSAVGQGALAIETRASGPGFDAARELDHAQSHTAVAAERAVLRKLGGGCQVPIGAHASVRDGSVRLLGLVASPDGSEVIRAEAEGESRASEELGSRLGTQLLEMGARRILERVYADSSPDGSGPLWNRRIAVTRAAGQNQQLTARLRALGAEVIEMPTIEIVPAPDYAALDAAISGLSSYDWIIFTSVNGVQYFFERLRHSGLKAGAIHACVCAIGPATKSAAEAAGLKVNVMGQEYVAESLLEAFAAHDLAGKRVLLPRAAVARDVVPEELERRGAHVDVVEAYRTVAPSRQSIDAGLAQKPECITFTSSSTVRNLVDAAGANVLAGIDVVSIGPVTTKTAKDLGIEVTAEARVFTMEGVVEAIVGMYGVK